jgi:hypothetical protein
MLLNAIICNFHRSFYTLWKCIAVGNTELNNKMASYTTDQKCLLFWCRLGGVVVSVLATGPKGCEFEPGQGDGFLRAVKIRSTPSCRMGSKSG